MTATTIKEYPVDCTAEEVRGILEGDLTELRRTVEPQPPADATDVFAWYEPGIPEPYKAQEGLYCWNPSGLHFIAPSVYGFPGDVLWVREVWMPFTEDGIPIGITIYQATDNPEPDGDGPLVWRSAESMPREASRFTLEIIDVKVERLNRIWHWLITFKRI